MYAFWKKYVLWLLLDTLVQYSHTRQETMSVTLQSEEIRFNGITQKFALDPIGESYP